MKINHSFQINSFLKMNREWGSTNLPYRVVGPCRLSISVNVSKVVPKLVTKRSPFFSCRYSKACPLTRCSCHNL